MAGVMQRVANGAARRVATRAQAAIVRAFEQAGADAAPRAIAFTPADKAQARAFERMVRFGAIKRASDLYWLDARGLAAFRKEELAHLLSAIAVAGFAAAGALALGR